MTELEDLQAEVVRLKSENEQLTDHILFIARWVERGIYGGCTLPEDALKIIARDSSMPWKSIVWDVDHLPYAEAFYKDFPQARPKK